MGVDLTVNTLFIRFASVLVLMMDEVWVRMVYKGICFGAVMFDLTVYICWVFGPGGLIFTN